MSRVPLKKIVYNNGVGEGSVSYGGNGPRSFRKENNNNNVGGSSKDLENLKYAYGKISDVYENSNQYNNKPFVGNGSSSKLEMIQEEQDFEPMAINTRRRNIINDFLPYKVPLTTAASNSLHHGGNGKASNRPIKKNLSLNAQNNEEAFPRPMKTSVVVDLYSNTTNTTSNNMGKIATTIVTAPREVKFLQNKNEITIAKPSSLLLPKEEEEEEANNISEEQKEQDVNQKLVVHLMKEKQEEKDLHEAEKIIMCEKIKQLETIILNEKKDNECKVSNLENLLKEKENQIVLLTNQVIMFQNEMDELRQNKMSFESEVSNNINNKMVTYEKLIEELNNTIKNMVSREGEFDLKLAAANEKINE